MGRSGNFSWGSVCFYNHLSRVPASKDTILPGPEALKAVIGKKTEKVACRVRQGHLCYRFNGKSTSS